MVPRTIFHTTLERSFPFNLFYSPLIFLPTPPTTYISQSAKRYLFICSSVTLLSIVTALHTSVSLPFFQLPCIPIPLLTVYASVFWNHETIPKLPFPNVSRRTCIFVSMQCPPCSLHSTNHLYLSYYITFQQYTLPLQCTRPLLGYAPFLNIVVKLILKFSDIISCIQVYTYYKVILFLIGFILIRNKIKLSDDKKLSRVLFRVVRHW